MRLSMRLASASLALIWGVCGAQPVNFSGTWHLNVDKSKWGTASKPHSVVLTVEHNEPGLHYHGAVVYANEDQREFAFSGAFDGKPYPMSRSFGDGNITLTRLDPWTFESVFKSDDGSTVEASRTTVSRDGRTLTRLLRVTSPAGVKKWTEVYEKR